MLQLALPTTVYIILGLLGAVSNTVMMKCPQALQDVNPVVSQEEEKDVNSCPSARGVNLLINLIGVGLWAALVEVIYRAGWHKTSWVLALLPFLIVIFVLVLFVGVAGVTGYK